MAASIRIRLRRSGLAKTLGVEPARLDEGPEDTVTLTVPIQLRRRGVEAKLVIADRDKNGADDPAIERLPGERE